MTGLRQEQAFAFVCRFIEQHGYSPTLEEIGDELGITPVGAWKHVQSLLNAGRLRRSRERDRYLSIPGRLDLRPVPTDVLIAEIARRRAVAHAEDSR